MDTVHYHRWARRRYGRECVDCGLMEKGEAAAAAVADHVHQLRPWVTFHRAPIGPYPDHTSFVVMLCPVCGEHAFFPPDNWALCTPAFRTLVESLVTEAGGFLARVVPRGTSDTVS